MPIDREFGEVDLTESINRSSQAATKSYVDGLTDPNTAVIDFQSDSTDEYIYIADLGNDANLKVQAYQGTPTNPGGVRSIESDIGVGSNDDWEITERVAGNPALDNRFDFVLNEVTNTGDNTYHLYGNAPSFVNVRIKIEWANIAGGIDGTTGLASADRLGSEISRTGKNGNGTYSFQNVHTHGNQVLNTQSSIDDINGSPTAQDVTAISTPFDGQKALHDGTGKLPAGLATYNATDGAWSVNGVYGEWTGSATLDQTIDTGVGSSTAMFDISLGTISGGAKAATRKGNDSADGTHTVEIVQSGTSVTDPSCDYLIRQTNP